MTQLSSELVFCVMLGCWPLFCHKIFPFVSKENPFKLELFNFQGSDGGLRLSLASEGDAVHPLQLFVMQRYRCCGVLLVRTF